MLDSSPRQKVTLRINTELFDLVRQIAERESVSPAGAMDRLLLEGLERYAQGTLKFDGYLQPTAQGRYRFMVRITVDGLRAAIAKKVYIT